LQAFSKHFDENTFILLINKFGLQLWFILKKYRKCAAWPKALIMDQLQFQKKENGFRLRRLRISQA
jgi:hypothetical protein